MATWQELFFVRCPHCVKHVKLVYNNQTKQFMSFCENCGKTYAIVPPTTQRAIPVMPHHDEPKGEER